MKGKITKEFEPYSKTPIHVLYEGGASVMIIPNQDKQFLQLQNPLLLFQFLLLNPKGFNIELNLRDTNHNKRKIFITTSITDKKSIHSLYKTFIFIIVTIFGAAVIVFLILVFFSLLSDALSYFVSIYREIIYRMN